MKKIIHLSQQYKIHLLTLMFFAPGLMNIQLASAQGGAPPLVNYQAVARDISGSLFVNQNISVRFTFHAGSAGGAIEYQETQSKTTNAFGLFTAAIGSGTGTSGTWASIDFSGADQYLQVEMDPAGGTAWTDMGTSQLISVPYAVNSLTTQAIAGSPNYIPKYNGANSIDVSSMYDAGGIIGIGTTTPQAHLHIADGGSNYYGLYVFKNGTGENAIFSKDNPASYTSNVTMSYNNTMGMPTLDCIASGNGAAGRFDGGTNGVGIQAQSSGGSPAVVISGNGTGNALLVSSNGAVATAGFSQNGTGIAGYFTSASGPGLVVENGNVGIGILTPAARIDVQDANGSTSILVNNTAGGVALDVTTSTGPTASLAHCGAFNGTGFFGECNTGTNAWGVAGFSSTGQGGHFSTTSGDAGYFNGNIAGTGTFTYTSDAKLKKNIRPLIGALDKILLLKPSTYQYKVGEFGSMTLPSGNHFGVIAQDLQQIFPELVKQEKYSGEKNKTTGVSADEFDYLSVNYNELIPVLIKGMQEQQVIINELKAELQTLKKLSTK